MKPKQLYILLLLDILLIISYFITWSWFIGVIMLILIVITTHYILHATDKIQAARFSTHIQSKHHTTKSKYPKTTVKKP